MIGEHPGYLLLVLGPSGKVPKYFVLQLISGISSEAK